MAVKKEVYKVCFVLAVLLLLILIAWKTHQRSKVTPGVFKDTAIVDLHYKVFPPVPPGNFEDVEPREDSWELSNIEGRLWWPRCAGGTLERPR